MFRRRILTVFLLTTLVAGAAIWLSLAPPTSYTQVEYRFRDLIARAGRTAPLNPDLIFLAIDSDSINLDPELDINGLFSSSTNDPESRRALEIMSKGWPWNREIYAMILKRLVSAGAKVVAFDCLFPAPAAGDDAFRSALDQFASQVVIGSNFVTPRNMAKAPKIRSSFDSPAQTLIPKAIAPDDRIGFTNFFTGENQIVRGAQYRVAFREQDKATAIYLSLSACAVSKAGHAQLVPHDLAEHLIRFTGPPRGGFKPHPIFELFCPRILGT